MSVKLRIDSLGSQYPNHVQNLVMDEYNALIFSVCKNKLRQTAGLDVESLLRITKEFLRWCREGESNPHEVALAGF